VSLSSSDKTLGFSLLNVSRRTSMTSSPTFLG
jgi:hypothetical protein